jgi:hypothetical protein
MFNEINIVIAISLLLLGFRYEYGFLTHSFTLHYSLLMMIGFDIIKSSVLDILDVCSWYCNDLILEVLKNLLLILLLYDSISTLVTGRYLMILIAKIMLICSVNALIYVTLAEDEIYMSYFTLSIISLLTVMMIIERILHHDNFRYGCIHQRYCYACIAIYLICLFILVLDIFHILPSIPRIDILLIAFVFNYHFQLNMLYKLTHWEYSAFIRSGNFSRILLIIDYYEIPDAKI